MIKPTETVQVSEQFTIPLERMVEAVKTNRLEGIVAKRLNSHYEPGQRSGAWVKQRLNRAQEFVIGGYRPRTVGFDSVLIGFYRDGELRYCASTRNGVVPATRREIFDRLRGLEIEECPFVNLPEANAGRWGAGLTAKKMSECRWVRPEVVVQFEFVEWTEGEHLRHAKYVGLRDDKDAQAVVRET